MKPPFPIPPHPGRGSVYSDLTPEQHYVKYPERWAKYFRESIECGATSIVTPRGAFESQVGVVEPGSYGLAFCVWMLVLGMLIGATMAVLLK